MCGITGILDTRVGGDIDAAALRRMNDSQWHRGPDEGSVHVEPGLGFGHRRLSIIDIATGQQPLFNEDHSVVVVFNGEIYNYQSLIPELQALGHVFRTKSDTEVIVHAWEAWGADCVKRFRGMFAFALWDRNRGTLFLGRDRLGVKPLYYAWLDDGQFLFGSELKSLLAHGGLSRTLDALAVEEYFALGYVAEPRTVFRQARKLAPGHTLLVQRGRSPREPQPYWDVRFSLDNPIRAIREVSHDLTGRRAVRLAGGRQRDKARSPGERHQVQLVPALRGEPAQLLDRLAGRRQLLLGHRVRDVDQRHRRDLGALAEQRRPPKRQHERRGEQAAQPELQPELQP